MTPSDTKGNNSLTGPASGNWTLVDEGGEEVRVHHETDISAQPQSMLSKRLTELKSLC